MMMTFTEVKGHQRSNVVNYATFLNIVILYYLLMRRDVWFANHLVLLIMKGNDYYIHRKFQVHNASIFGLGAKNKSREVATTPYP